MATYDLEERTQTPYSTVCIFCSCPALEWNRDEDGWFLEDEKGVRHECQFFSTQGENNESN